METAAFTSCTTQVETDWNYDPSTIKYSLQSWLLSTVTLLTNSLDRETKYHQVTHPLFSSTGSCNSLNPT